MYKLSPILEETKSELSYTSIEEEGLNGNNNIFHILLNIFNLFIDCLKDQSIDENNLDYWSY